MHEWTIHIDSPPGAGATDTHLERAHELIPATAAIGPAVSRDVDGSIGSTFQLAQETVDGAASELFSAVLREAGVAATLARPDRMTTRHRC